MIPRPGCLAREREQAHRTAGAIAVAGVDEVGRGALAGPVVAAAVILPPELCPDGLNDSKLLLPAHRERLYHEILDAACGLAIYYVGPGRIDEINILRSTHEAMAGALCALLFPAEVALVDGLPVPGLPCCHEAIVRGDGQECCIAAASIVAKVTRDRLMSAYAACYPAYGFERHKGYATPEHRKALQTVGPCAIHRRSFLNFMGQESALDGSVVQGAPARRRTARRRAALNPATAKFQPYALPRLDLN